jgi:hypothetical protein
MIQAQNTKTRIKPQAHKTEEQIYATGDYDLFGLVGGNRQVNHGHVAHLISSIAKKNMLKDNPILVNEKYEIIDGQHRVHAARALGVPIYFKIVSGTALAEVQLLNAHNKPWELRDYLDSYIALNNRDYIELDEFCSTYELSISMGIMLLSDFTSRPKELLRLFRDGDFKVANKEKAVEFADRIYDLKGFCMANVWHDRELMRALQQFYRTHSHQKLMERLRAENVMIMRSATVGDYLRQLEQLA